MYWFVLLVIRNIAFRFFIINVDSNWAGTDSFRPLNEHRSQVTMTFDYTPSKTLPSLTLYLLYKSNAYQVKNIIPLCQRVRIDTNITGRVFFFV
jgi:hypothetical protein